MDNQELKTSTKTYQQTIIAVLIVVIVALLISNGASIFLFVTQGLQNNQNLNTFSDNANLNSELKENLNIANLNEVTIEQQIVIPKDNNLLAIKWQQTKDLTPNSFFTSAQLLELQSLVSETTDYASITPFVSETGIILNGTYKDSPLYNILYRKGWNGPGPEELYLYRVVKNSNNMIVVIKNDSDSIQELPNTGFIIDKNLTLFNLETPESITIPNSNLKFIKAGAENDNFNESAYEKLFKYDEFSYLYKDPARNCFLAKAGDNTIRIYRFDLPFINAKEGSLDYSVPNVYDFAFTDGKKNTYDYSLVQRGGCGGIGGCYTYSSYIQNIEQLQILGFTPQNGPIYELKDINITVNPDIKVPVLEGMYAEYYPGWDDQTQKTLEKISFNEFLDLHPIIFWQDPFGKFIEFHNAQFVPMAECGKPVIYLYPETTTNVSVTVTPNGGFKLTEPAYNKGWYVQAQPNGALYNYTDKKSYPYLFWEGYALNYLRPSQGFVVPQDKVETFLAEKLAAFGLIPQEYNEFIEFWAPKMQDAPYYFVTFMPQAEFDQYAPLTVKPAPDTIIRVFMDYEQLLRPIKVQPQIIKKTERLGFTVVEWGGALHK